MVTFKPYPMIIDGLTEHSLSTSQFIAVVRFKIFTSRNSEPNVFFHFKKTRLWNNFYRFRMRYTNVTYIQVSPNYHPTIRTTTTTMWMFADSSAIRVNYSFCSNISILKRVTTLSDFDCNSFHCSIACLNSNDDCFTVYSTARLWIKIRLITTLPDFNSLFYKQKYMDVLRNNELK